MKKQCGTILLLALFFGLAMTETSSPRLPRQTHDSIFSLFSRSMGNNRGGFLSLQATDVQTNTTTTDASSTNITTAPANTTDPVVVVTPPETNTTKPPVVVVDPPVKNETKPLNTDTT